MLDCEITCLRWTADHVASEHIRQIEKFQEKGYKELEEHCKNTHRFAQLLLRLPALRLLDPGIMEELFFAGLIGNVQIDSIIPYILRMETAEYNSQVGPPVMQVPASPQAAVQAVQVQPVVQPIVAQINAQGQLQTQFVTQTQIQALQQQQQQHVSSPTTVSSPAQIVTAIHPDTDIQSIQIFSSPSVTATGTTSTQ